MAPIDWKVTEDGERWFKFNSKFDKFKYFYGHWVSLILFLIVIISVVWLGVYVYQNKTAFFENPLVYGIRQMGEKNDGLAYCDCYIESESKGFLKFMINDSGYTPIRQITRYTREIEKIDTSDWEKFVVKD